MKKIYLISMLILGLFQAHAQTLCDSLLSVENADTITLSLYPDGQHRSSVLAYKVNNCPGQAINILGFDTSIFTSPTWGSVTGTDTGLSIVPERVPSTDLYGEILFTATLQGGGSCVVHIAQFNLASFQFYTSTNDTSYVINTSDTSASCTWLVETNNGITDTTFVFDSTYTFPTISIDSGTTYKITLIATNGSCSDTAVSDNTQRSSHFLGATLTGVPLEYFTSQNIEISTAIKPIQLNDVSLFPNPATSYFILSAGTKFKIFNSAGDFIFGDVSNGAVNVNNFPRGLYFILIDNGKIGSKILLQ